MRSLADTNVLSELAKPRRNAGVVAWLASVERMAISAVTVEEIAFGLEWKPSPRKTRDWFSRFFVEVCDILPITAAIADHAGSVRGRFQRMGVTRSPADMLIAATAYVHGLTLVTRNVRDFEECQIDVFNPFA